jgi:ketosteroid isomerase-like protein
MTMTPVASTEAVVGHHLQCFGARDLEGILSDYTPESVICAPNGVVRGREAMVEVFRGFFAEFGKPGTTFNLQQQAYEGEIGYITWTAETADNSYELGTDTFLVRDGKIVTQTFAAKVTPKG